MSELTRRHFLKLGGAAGAAVALTEALAFEAAADDRVAGGASVSRVTRRPRQKVPTVCGQCTAQCGVLAFVEQDWVVKIEGNPEDPNSRGKICAKGLAAVSLVQDEDRLLHPLRRTGARGSGGWQQMTWDEAVAEIGGKLAALRASGRNQEFVFHGGIGAEDLLVNRFLRAFENPTVAQGFNFGLTNKRVALEQTAGKPYQTNDVVNARYILNFGANPYEADPLHVPLVQRIVQARAAGARLVTLDPRLSNTAGRSDEWVPLLPGTDGVVALAMAQVIVSEERWTGRFIEEWSNVSKSELVQHLAGYTPEEAEQISGVPAATIQRIAREFARAGQATTLSGAGISFQLNGTFNERCILLLNAVAGYIDAPGGYCLARQLEIPDPPPAPPPLARANAGVAGGRHVASETIMPLIASGALPVQVYLAYARNPVYSDPSSSLAARTLSDEKLVPFFVAVDTHLSETATLADIVLPDATFLERWGLMAPPAFDMVPFVSLRQPAMLPPAEVRDFQSVVIDLSRRIGGGMERFFPGGRPEKYLVQVTDLIPGLRQVGGLDYLKKHGVWYDPALQAQYALYQDGGFATPSRKFQISVPDPDHPDLPRLPSYVPPAALQEGAEGQFLLVTYKWHVHSNSRTANNKWLAEIVHDNPMWLNARVAEEMGVKSGDVLEVASGAGRLRVKVRVTQAIHPRVVAISGNLGHWAMGNVALAKKYEGTHPDSRLIWWSSYGNGINPNSVIPVVPALVGGEQAWQGTPVRLFRV